MTFDSRVVAPQQKIGSRPTSDAAAAAAAPAAKGGKKKKKLMMIVGALLVVVLAAAYYFLAGPGKATTSATDPSAAPTVEAEPEYDLGEVLVIDSVSINLQGGHYLRLGLGLQLIEGAGGSHGAIDPAKALDAAIALYSGHTTEELADAAVREDLKTQLEETLFDLYHEEVVAVYYTDFVTQ